MVSRGGRGKGWWSSAPALLGFALGGAGGGGRRGDHRQLLGEAGARPLHRLPLDLHPDAHLQPLREGECQRRGGTTRPPPPPAPLPSPASPSSASAAGSHGAFWGRWSGLGGGEVSAGGREADPPPFTPLPPPKPSAPRTAPRSRAPLTSLPRPPRPPGRGPPRRRPPGPLGRCLGPALGHVAAALPGSRTARGTPGYNWTANRTACRDRTRRKQFSPSRRPLLTPAPPRSASACRSSAGAKTPHSVTMPPVMRSWGVTSKAGFHTSIPGDSGGGGRESKQPCHAPPHPI